MRKQAVLDPASGFQFHVNALHVADRTCDATCQRTSTKKFYDEISAGGHKLHIIIRVGCQVPLGSDGDNTLKLLLNPDGNHKERAIATGGCQQNVSAAGYVDCCLTLMKGQGGSFS